MIVETLLACEVKGLLDVLVVGIEAQDTRDERAVGAVAAVGMGKGVPQAKGDLGDAPSSRLAATWAQRRAPAVCDELGPTPMVNISRMLNMYIALSFPRLRRHAA